MRGEGGVVEGDFKHLPMTNNIDRSLIRASKAGDRLSRAAGPAREAASAGGARSRPTAPSLMSVPFAVRRHGSISVYIRRLEW